MAESSLVYGTDGGTRIFLAFGVRISWILRTASLPAVSGRKDHGNGAVKAADIDDARGADTNAAAGTDIFAGAAGLFGQSGKSRAAVGASAADLETAELIAVDQDIGQTVIKNEVKQLFAGFGGAPSVTLAVAHDQTVGFCCGLEALVVVGVAAAAILNAVGIVEVVAHLMKERGADILNGSGQRASADVDLMGLAVLGDPSIVPQGEVTVSLRRGLDRDGRS